MMKDKTLNTCHNQKKFRFPPDNFFMVHPRWYITGFLLFSLIRIIWTSDRGLQHNLHDPLLYLECAKHIACGNWLGPLHVVTLSKTCLFPLFISLSFITGISYLLMVDICWCLAALLAVAALFPILKRTASLLLYAALIFQPMLYQRQLLSIHELYLLLVFCCIFCFAGVWIRYSPGKGFPLPWLIGGGLFFSLADHTREEGNVWIVLIVAYALLILIRSVRADKLPAGKLIRRFLFAGAVLIITYGAVDLPIRFVNYRHYQFFGCNIRKSHAWKQFMGTLLGVARDLDPRWDIRVPVRYDILDLLYELSPNLAKLKPFIRRDSFFAIYPAERFPKEELQRCPDLVNNIKGGFLQWELLAAMENMKLMKRNNWHDVEAFLYAAVDDFRQAAKAGKLKKLTIRNSNLPPYDQQMRDWFIRKIIWTVKRVFITSESLEPVRLELPDMEGIQFHENELYRSLKSDTFYNKRFFLAAGWGFQQENGGAPLKKEAFISNGNIFSFQIQRRQDVRDYFVKKFPRINDRIGFRVLLTDPMLEIRNDSGHVIYKGDIRTQKNGIFLHWDIVRPVETIPFAEIKRKSMSAHCLWIRDMMKWLLCASLAMAVFLLFRTFRTGFGSPYFKILIAGTSLWCSAVTAFLVVIFANVMLHCPRYPHYLFPSVILLYNAYCVLLIGGGSLLIRMLAAGSLKSFRRSFKSKIQ